MTGWLSNMVDNVPPKAKIELVFTDAAGCVQSLNALLEKHNGPESLWLGQVPKDDNCKCKILLRDLETLDDESLFQKYGTLAVFPPNGIDADTPVFAFLTEQLIGALTEVHVCS